MDNIVEARNEHVANCPECWKFQVVEYSTSVEEHICESCNHDFKYKCGFDETRMT